MWKKKPGKGRARREFLKVRFRGNMKGKARESIALSSEFHTSQLIMKLSY
jgi:hypothetical protein